jgi:hypothetical protein
MTFFGIKLLDDIDLPEFPFPDLGPLAERPRCAEPGERDRRRRGGPRATRARALPLTTKPVTPISS